MGFMPGSVLRYLSKALVYLTGNESTLQINLYTAQNIYSSAITLAIGIAAFVLVLRKFFRKQTEGKWVYFNPIPDSLNLEDVLYIPLGKILYRSGLAVFSVVDAAILIPSEWITSIVKQISEIRIKKIDYNCIEVSWQRRFTKKVARAIELPVNEKMASDKVKDSNKVIEENLGGIFVRLRYRFNSIIYGIFIFAIVLVLILFKLIYNQM
jgi:hypothetical protein